MSIINDALKKVQKNIEKKEDQVTPIILGQPPEKSIEKTDLKFNKKKKRLFPFLRYFLYACVAFLLLYKNPFITSMLLPTNSSKTKIPNTTITDVSAINTELSELPALPEQPKQTQQEIPAPPKIYSTINTSDILTGIVIMDGVNFALINDFIYEEGEIFKGKTINKILSNKIELIDSSGNIEILTVQEKP